MACRRGAGPLSFRRSCMATAILSGTSAGEIYESMRRVTGCSLALLILLCSWSGGAYCSGGTAADSTAGTAPSPKGALLRSVVYPGWGQLANGKPYKACVIMAVEAYLAGVAISSDRSARDAGELAWAAATPGEAEKYEERSARYEERRNAYFWWLGATILYSMLDAYVDANLAGVSEGASEPPPVLLDSHPAEGGGIEFTIMVRF